MLSSHLLGYIDPGSGSIIFQALVAGVLAVSVGFRQARLWIADKVRSLVGRRKGEPVETGAAARTER